MTESSEHNLQKLNETAIFIIKNKINNKLCKQHIYLHLYSSFELVQVLHLCSLMFLIFKIYLVF